MQGNHFTVSWYLDGTLAANKVLRWLVPFNCTLVQVSAAASNDSDATLKIGTAADDDAFLVAATIGDSGTPNERDRDDFVGGEWPRVNEGDVVLFTLDFDGAAGTAAQNVSMVATFCEG
jgi:hypothetical protein